MSEGMRLHDAQGRRKYLTDAERRAFLAAGKVPRPVRTLCLVLAYTGCRTTEALELTASRIDIEAGQIVGNRPCEQTVREDCDFLGVRRRGKTLACRAASSD